MVIYEAFVEGRVEAPKHLARTVHDLYFEPKYEECSRRTIWSLSNAFTSAFKELDPIRSSRPPPSIPGSAVLAAVLTGGWYPRPLPGAIGNDAAELPQMSASATIQPDGDGSWTILEHGEVRATYPSRAIRFSVLWKADVRNGDARPDNLTLDQIMAIFTADLRHRGIDFHVPSDPLADTPWILLLQRIYVPTSAPGA